MTIMLDEIREEPEAIIKTYNYNRIRAREISETIRESQLVYITGSGTSFHAASFLSALLLKSGHAAVPVQASDYDDFLAEKIPQHPLNIIFSQSGESIDAISNMELSRKKKIRVIGVTNEIDSTLSREADVCLITRAGTEKSVAATKSHSVQLAVSMLLYQNVSGTESQAYFQQLTEGIAAVIKSEESIRRVAMKMSEHIVFLGSGLDFPIATEGDLKFKETSGANAESYSTREYLHGPIHRLDRNTTVILLRGDGERDYSVLRKISGITSQTFTLGKEDSSITVPENGPFVRPFFYLTALQMMANFFAVRLGQDPDHPKNLTKVVTE